MEGKKKERKKTKEKVLVNVSNSKCIFEKCACEYEWSEPRDGVFSFSFPGCEDFGEGSAIHLPPAGLYVVVVVVVVFFFGGVIFFCIFLFMWRSARPH